VKQGIDFTWGAAKVYSGVVLGASCSGPRPYGKGTTTGTPHPRGPGQQSLGTRSPTPAEHSFHTSPLGRVPMLRNHLKRHLVTWRRSLPSCATRA